MLQDPFFNIYLCMVQRRKLIKIVRGRKLIKPSSRQEAQVCLLCLSCMSLASPDKQNQQKKESERGYYSKLVYTVMELESLRCLVSKLDIQASRRCSHSSIQTQRWKMDAPILSQTENKFFPSYFRPQVGWLRLTHIKEGGCLTHFAKPDIKSSKNIFKDTPRSNIQPNAWALPVNSTQKILL